MRLLSRRLIHASAGTNVSPALGACAVSRYGRYKSGLRRHTHDTLGDQNGAFEWRHETVPSLLHREREKCELHLAWKPATDLQLIHQLLPLTMAVAGTTDSRNHDLAH